MSKAGGFNKYRVECDNDLIERLKNAGYDPIICGISSFGKDFFKIRSQKY